MKSLSKPQVHPLKPMLKKKKVALYKLKFILGEKSPSASELWLMLSGYKEMPLRLEKEIQEVLNKK
jgi:hypothetical protein